MNRLKHNTFGSGCCLLMMVKKTNSPFPMLFESQENGMLTVTLQPFYRLEIEKKANSMFFYKVCLQGRRKVR